MRIGYLINTYPRPSHSFIRREIAALESLGLSVHRFAMRGERMALNDPDDLAEHDRTEHILARGIVGLLPGVVQLFRHPRALASGLAMAWQRARQGESSLLRQLIYLAEAAQIAHRARELGIGHVHAHFGTNSTRVAAMAHLLGGPGYSFTVHGPEEFDAPQRLDLSGKLTAARFCVTVSSYGRSQMYRWAQGADISKVQVVHCGLDMARWSDPRALPDGPLRMVAIGRFAEQKGFGLLVEAFAQAWQQRPDLRLTLVGDGELRPQIEARIAAAGMESAVELLGWQDETGVRAAIDAAHVLVTPSFAEGLPVVIMEAMACARPVIATYIAGIPELVRPGQDGWLVPAGDAFALAQAMLQAAACSPATLAEMGAAARARVLERHDIRISAQQLAALFSRATG